MRSRIIKLKFSKRHILSPKKLFLHLGKIEIKCKKPGRKGMLLMTPYLMGIVAKS